MFSRSSTSPSLISDRKTRLMKGLDGSGFQIIPNQLLAQQKTQVSHPRPS